MVCKNCGREIADTSKFCGYCGNKVEPDVSFDMGAIPSIEDFDFNKIDLGKISIPTVEEPKVNVVEPVVGKTQYVEPTPVQPDYSWISETAPKPVTPQSISVQPDIEKQSVVQPTPQNIESQQPLYDMFNIEPTVEKTTIQQPLYDAFNIQPAEQSVEPSVSIPEPIELQQPLTVEPEVELKPFADVQQSVEQTLEKPIEKVEPIEPQVQPQVIVPTEQQKEEKIEKKDNKRDFTVFIIVFLTVVIVMLSAFIVWDKYLNKTPNNNVQVEQSGENENTTNMTVQDAKDIASDKYNNLYGDNFKNIYEKVLKGDTETASSMFTMDAINKLKVDTQYKTGIFGTEGQTKRDLEVVSYGDEYIIAKGKNSTDSVYYYIVLKKVEGIWYIDMFE